MIRTTLENVLLLCVVVAAIWLYGGMIASKFRRHPEKARRFARRFRFFGVALALPCFIVGLLYRAHVLSFTVAVVLYIPEVVGFAVGLWRLQPYLTAPEEDINHE